MKTITRWTALCLALVASALATQTGYSQQPAAPSLPRATEGESGLQKFDLDFPGGSPRALVSAIEKATGKPLNAIVPQEFEKVEIPPMKFHGVTIPALFQALTMASQKTERLGDSLVNSAYSFQTQGQGEDAIWYFHYEKPPRSPEYCRFYQLGGDLQNYSVQDITTAIQTGWKLLGVQSTPQLKFHPETKLLIAVGQVEQLRTIDSVLQELRKAPQSQDSARKKDAASSKQ